MVGPDEQEKYIGSENEDELEDKSEMTSSEPEIDYLDFAVQKNIVLPSEQHVSARADKSEIVSEINDNRDALEIPSEKLADDQRRAKPLPSTATGETRAERLKNAIEIGGLKSLPKEYEPTKDNKDADWKTICSDNYFERLYMDYSLCASLPTSQVIDIVNKNYQVLKSFWENKRKTIEESPIADKIAKLYDTTKGEFKKFLTLLEEAYGKLNKEEKVEYYIRELEAKRKKDGKDILNKRFEIAVKQWKQIDDSDVAEIQKVASSETQLRPSEVTEIIEEWIKRYGLKRVNEKLPEAQIPLFKQLKNKIKDDKFLSIDEESELRDDYKEVVDSESFENLARRALYEVGDSERESSLENDKKEYEKFYYEILLQNGSDDVEKIKSLVSHRQNSRDEFIPLRNQTRQKLEKNVLRRYRETLEKQKSEFKLLVKQKISRRDVLEKAEKELLAVSDYDHLLPYMKKSIIAETISEMENAQEKDLEDALISMFKITNWDFSLDLPTFEKQCVQSEHKVVLPPNNKELSIDWIYDKIAVIFSAAKESATKQYIKEKESFSQALKRAYSKNRYGLPIDLQLKIETDNRIYLSQEERRRIIIEQEKVLRENAKADFEKLIQKNIVQQTLLPEKREKLIQEGHNKFLLSEEKNGISYRVETAEQIISRLTRSIESVLREKIDDLSHKYALSEEDARFFELSCESVIPQKEIDELVASFDKAQRSKLLIKIINSILEEKKIQIIRDSEKDEYLNLLIQKAHTLSQDFSKEIDEWLNFETKNKFIKIGSMFGLTEKQANEIIETEFAEWYASITRPKWAIFWLVVIGASIFFVLLRITLSASGIEEWSFAGAEIQEWKPTFGNFISFSDALSFGKEYAHVTAFFLILAFIIYYLFIKRTSD